MAVSEIPIKDAKVGDRISIDSGGSVRGVYLVRESKPLELDRIAIVLQSVNGGADTEATFEAGFPVGLVPHESDAR